MRTFHTGGVAGSDITHGLPRVVEIFEARNPKGAATLAELGGKVELEDTERGPRITIHTDEVDENGEPLEPVAYALPRRTRILVENAGDTELLPGQLVDKVVLERANEAARTGKRELATFEPLILGLTKASLATESVLSAATFQETTKVLTDASIEGKVDRLLGLKENVIIGKLIPAATGLKKYRGIDIEPAEPLPAAMFGGGTEAELLAALEEIGDGDGLDLSALGLDYDADLPELPELPDAGVPDEEA